MLQLCGERAQDRKIRGSFQIKYPAALLSLIVVLESYVFERLQTLVGVIVQPERLTHKCHDHVPGNAAKSMSARRRRWAPMSALPNKCEIQMANRRTPRSERDSC